MPQSLVLGLSAVIALIPLALVSWRKAPARDALYWLAVLVGIAGPAAWVAVQTADTWHTGLATALWVTVTASTALFLLVSAFSREGWRLAPLFAPYMVILAALALIWQHDPGAAPARTMPTAATAARWIGAHILFSVSTYALVTLAAVAALGAALQENALKSKRPMTLTRLLPSLADCERLTVRLLAVAAVILALGLMTGMAIQYGENGQLLRFDHKTVLSLTAFIVISGLLFAHYRSGLRGRKAARVVLLAYLLMTLGYPGVKFVTDALLT